MFFPPDVSLRVIGEGDAQALFPRAKQLLFRALRMQETGGGVPVKLFLPGTDGSLVYVWLHQGLKHVIVQPAPPREVLVSVEIPLAGFISLACVSMLSGVVRPGSSVPLLDGDGNPRLDADGNPLYAAHEFHPTAVNASVYGIPDKWQDVERLGVTADPENALPGTLLQVRWPKPSMYTGAMKRVVQAVYGIGQTKFNDEFGASQPFTARSHYRCLWISSDGLHKVGDDFWVVRIDRDIGVVAMPLPRFECSATPEFLQALVDIGDSDTASVVAEFGALPTGADFPEDLSTAIEDGRVLRLLTIGQLAPFYHDAVHDLGKFSLYAYCGWAFSESGAATDIHNTCFWYSNEAAATAEITTWATDGFDAIPLADRMLRAEQWKITLALSEIDRKAATPGTGSALLTLVEASLMIGPPFYVNTFRNDLAFFKVPEYSASADITTLEFWGRTSTALHELSYASVRNVVYDISCPVTVFYIGETLEVVRHQPRKTYEIAPIRGPWQEGVHGLSGSGGDPSGVGFAGVLGFFGPGPCSSRGGIAGFALATFHAFGTYVVEHYILNPGSPDPCACGNAVCCFHHWEVGSDVQVIPVDFTLPIDGVSVSAFDYYEPALSYTTTTSLYPNASCLGSTVSVPVVASASYVVNYRPNVRRSGRFYSTSIDLRSERRWRSVKSNTPVPEMIDYADQWEEEVGLVLPPMCREGAVFVRSFFGNTDEVGTVHSQLPAGVEQIGLIPGLGAGSVPMPTLPAEEVNYLSGNGNRWQSIWTSMFNYQFHFSASINAGPTKCGVIADGVSRNEYAHDFALEGFMGGSIPVLDLPPSYIGTAGGIDITGQRPLDVTFVGAV